MSIIYPNLRLDYKVATLPYKLQQEVQETLKWKWITKLGSSWVW